MNKTYTPKRKIISDYIEATFYPSDGDEIIYEVVRADLELALLRQYGISKAQIDSVLELYVETGLLAVTDKKISRTDAEEI